MPLAASLSAMVPADGDYFAREAYTIEAFTDPSDLDRAETRLLATLGTHCPVRIEPHPGPVGRA